jgi:hypothetical protein
MKNRPNILSLIDRLATGESAFLQTRFLAPVAGGNIVRVRIGGAVCSMRIRPADFTGWGVFKPTSYTAAKLERPATMTERASYLRLFPEVQFILTMKQAGQTWLAHPARLGDTRFTFDGLVPILGVDDAELFDTVAARFDGSRFWFDQIDSAGDPSIAAYLRESIVAMRDPRLIDRAGLTPEQRLSYAAIHAERLRRKLADAHASGEYRLRQAVEHAGAKLRDFSELHGVYRVSYSVDGRQHTSIIRKNDLTVQSAGVCLSGEDVKFDLTSLVSVLRLGHEQGGLRHGLEV